MIQGRVNPRGEPVVHISLISSTNRSRSYTAVIDTGFNGTLSLSESLIRRLGWRWIGHESYEIATGDVVREKVFVGLVRWMQRIREVDVVASHARDILIGTRLLQGNRLFIDFLKCRVRIS
jgi:clan AA aspartic protease